MTTEDANSSVKFDAATQGECPALQAHALNQGIKKSHTSISPPLLMPHSRSPTSLSSPPMTIHPPSNALDLNLCDPGGIPVTGSSLALSWATLHDGLMRRSAERRGAAAEEEEEDGPGTVMVSGMSGAVWRDIVGCWMVVVWVGGGRGYSSCLYCRFRRWSLALYVHPDRVQMSLD